MANIAGAVVTSLIGGLTSYLQSSSTSRKAKAQAQRLKNNVTMLQNEISKGELDLGDAMARIDTMINTTKGELKGIMEDQVNRSVKQIREQYKTALGTTMDNIKQELSQRRLMGSEFGQETRAKTATKLSEEAGEQVTNTRQQAMDQIAKQMAELDLKGGMIKEGQRDAFKNFRLGAIGEMMQLQNMQGTLESQAGANPWLAALSGASGGLGQIASSFFEKKHKSGETPS